MKTLPVLFLLGSLVILTETRPIEKSGSYRKVDGVVNKIQRDIRHDLSVVNKQHYRAIKLHTAYLRHERNYRRLRDKYNRLYKHYYRVLKSTTKKKTSVAEIRKQLIQELNLLDNVKKMLRQYASYAKKYENLKHYYANLNCSKI